MVVLYFFYCFLILAEKYDHLVGLNRDKPPERMELNVDNKGWVIYYQSSLACGIK